MTTDPIDYAAFFIVLIFGVVGIGAVAILLYTIGMAVASVGAPW